MGCPKVIAFFLPVRLVVRTNGFIPVKQRFDSSTGNFRVIR